MNKLQLKYLILCFLLLAAHESAYSQYLTTKVNFQFENISADQLFQKVEKTGEFKFSYTRNIIDANRRYSYSQGPCSLHQLLTRTLGAEYIFEEKGKYIIVKRNRIKKGEKILDGYIGSEAGEPLKDVTVYSKRRLNSTQTSSLGYYRMKIRESDSITSLTLSKFNYIDTTISIIQKVDSGITDSIGFVDTIKVPFYHLKPLKKTYDRFSQDLSSLIFKPRIEEKNVEDTLYRKLQIGFLPYLGTNRKLSPRVVNAFSLNLLGGLSFGNSQLELAGIFNVNRSYVHGLQMAGLFNIAGKEISGAQFAGVFNYNGSNVSGAQFAGLFNLSEGTISGLQFAGLFNSNPSSAKGGQFAGLFNYSKGSRAFIQFAGLTNVSDSSNLQVAPFNFSHYTGFQLGVFNFTTDSSTTQLGILSFNSKGCHSLEFAYNSERHAEIAFRTGNYTLFNLLMTTISTESNDTTEWSFGYGLGTSKYLFSKWLMSFEISSQQLVQGGSINSLNLNNRAILGVQYFITKKTSIYAGLSYNQSLSDNARLMDDYMSPTPSLFQDKYNNLFTNAWLGWKIGLRFF